MMPPEVKLEDRLRHAFRDAGAEIPATPPPLALGDRPEPRYRWSPRGTWSHGWRGWGTPLAAAAAVIVIVAAALSLTSGTAVRPASRSDLDGVPAFYVALAGANVAQLRSTATGAVLAATTLPSSYRNVGYFTGVTGAANDRTFVLVAIGASHPPASVEQRNREYPRGYVPPERLFLLRINPASTDRGRRMKLTALPSRFVPAAQMVHAMALSPDGRMLAADVGGALGDIHLDTFDLATGAERSWSYAACSHCTPVAGILTSNNLSVNWLSWAGDGVKVAFLGPDAAGTGTAVRLLDTHAAGSNLLNDSAVVAKWPGPSGPDLVTTWEGAVVTPDGKSVLADLEIAPGRAGQPATVGEELVKVTIATGHVTILDNLDALNMASYEQILYTNPSGSTLVVAYARPGTTAGILRNGHYTAIPWSDQIEAAAF